jgi:ribosome-associated heat shock protein Hsp15
MIENVRADKWLWAVRCFKTRSQATKACAAGKVRRAGAPLKPASTLQVGDMLEVPFGEGPGIRSITVMGLIEKRVGAPEAALCYSESTPEAVLQARKEMSQQRRQRREGDQGRPTKQKRRAIQQIRGFFD